MRKFLAFLVMVMLSVITFSQSAQLNRLNYDEENGYYFKNITDSLHDTLYLGKTNNEAIETIDYFICICQDINSNYIWNRYADVNNNKYIIVRQVIDSNNGRKDGDVRLIYSREYGVPGSCSWYIMEGELHTITNYLYLNKKK